MKYEEALRHVGRIGEKLNVRYLYALSGMTQKQLDLFRDRWSEIGTERRRSVVRELAELTEESFEVNFDPVFILAMADEDSQVRTAAIKGLWENEDRGLIAPLIYLLQSDDSDIVRAAAATALGRYMLLGELEKIDEATGALVEDTLRAVIDNPNETTEVRRRSVESIAYSSRAGVRRIIREAFYSDDERMQGSALFAMGRSADPRWRQLLVEELDSQSPVLRYEAARACGELELSQTIPRLGDMAFNDPDAEVQQAAVWALGSIGGREARRLLESCYDSDDHALSNAAADALDEIDLLGEGLSIPLFDELDEDMDDEDLEFVEREDE